MNLSFEDEEFDELSNDDISNNLYEHHNIKVDKGQVMMRIDKFINIFFEI